MIIEGNVFGCPSEVEITDSIIKGHNSFKIHCEYDGPLHHLHAK